MEKRNIRRRRIIHRISILITEKLIVAILNESLNYVL